VSSGINLYSPALMARSLIELLTVFSRVLGLV